MSPNVVTDANNSGEFRAFRKLPRRHRDDRREVRRPDQGRARAPLRRFQICDGRGGNPYASSAPANGRGHRSPVFNVRPVMTNGTQGTVSSDTVPIDGSSQVVGSTVLRFINRSDRISANLILTLDDQGFVSINSTGPCTASVMFSLTLERIDISRIVAHEVVEASTPRNGQVPISFRPRTTFSIEPGGTLELRDGGDAVARATAPSSHGSAVAVISATEVFSITNNSSAEVIMETSALPANGLNLSLVRGRSGVDELGACRSGAVYATDLGQQWHTLCADHVQPSIHYPCSKSNANFQRSVARRRSHRLELG